MEKTKINWATSTFNPWQGCTKVSAGCDHCYAERLDARNLYGEETHWGAGVARRLFSETNWQKPLAWDRKASREGTRPRVFCASVADWADKEAPVGQRDRLWETIRNTPHLDWLLLTKRAPNIKKYLPTDWGKTGYTNCWLGVQSRIGRKAYPELTLLGKFRQLSGFSASSPC